MVEGEDEDDGVYAELDPVFAPLPTIAAPTATSRPERPPGGRHRGRTPP
ncbi:hypothetical protein [Streptomyces lincolnensis]|nr:hypothetical protein [Streptomyces lincolnensis]